MASLPDPETPPRTDRRLAAGLLGLFGVLMLVALGAHRLVLQTPEPPVPASSNSSPPLS